MLSDLWASLVPALRSNRSSILPCNSVNSYSPSGFQIFCHFPVACHCIPSMVFDLSLHFYSSLLLIQALPSKPAIYFHVRWNNVFYWGCCAETLFNLLLCYISWKVIWFHCLQQIVMRCSNHLLSIRFLYFSISIPDSSYRASDLCLFTWGLTFNIYMSPLWMKKVDK